MCLHRPATWAGRRAGPPISECVSPLPSLIVLCLYCVPRWGWNPKAARRYDDCCRCRDSWRTGTRIMLAFTKGYVNQWPVSSAADPGCLSRIWLFPSRIPDPDLHQRILVFLTQKTLALKNKILDSKEIKRLTNKKINGYLCNICVLYHTLYKRIWNWIFNKKWVETYTL